MFRRISSGVASLLVAASLIVLSSAPANAAVLTISGTVTDSRDGSPMDNVCITVGVPGQFCWTITNSVGKYFIDLGALEAQPGQNWDLFFIRAGFDTLKKTVLVNGAETANVVMIPTPGQTPPATIPPRTNVLNPPPAAPPPPTYTVYLPNVTKTLGGANGWHTPFIVQNVGTVATSLTVTFYSFADGSPVATRTATVQPGRSFVDSPRDEADLPGNAQFSVVITSAGAPVVAVVNEHQGPGAGNEALSYSGISSGSTASYLPLVSKMVSGWLTTMIIQNVGSASTTASASFTSLDGTKTATLTRSMAPGRSAVIDPRFESALADGTEYSATVTASQPIAVVANNHNDLSGTIAPMGDSYNGVTVGGPATTYLPYLAKNTDGVGRTSRVVVQNAGGTAATPIVSLYEFGSGVSSSVMAPSIAPGGAWSFAPTAGGEYSATIAGGTFAAVATAISPATAMYYTGTTATASKLFMPNVTRRLTQNAAVDPGWNTPLLIQSATATSATLTWYRFSDGSLVTSQTVPLTQNVTTRVDPTTVAGLSDNSQYSVVLETAGTVVSIVTQLNLVGGDDAMIYKGFAVLP